MINLFEYQNKVAIQNGLEGLEDFLDEIWNARERTSYYTSEDDDKIESQRFIQFIHKTNELKSNKYVGVIKYETQTINLLPKIFFNEDQIYDSQEIQQIQNHILWWLSYCRKIKFPNYKTTLGDTKSDFFEVLIYLFAKYTRKLLNSTIYQQYEEVNKELSYIKGRLDVPKYLNHNLSTGRWHKLNCSYDAFVFDNEFNRIIKHVTTLLFQVTTNAENKKFLREILFILDEVTDKRMTAAQCANISFNPMFGVFEIVRDYCQLFLSNCISFDYKNELNFFAFLIPMESLFEDFVFGFIDQEIDIISAKAQRRDTYLDEEKTFQLRPDLWLQLADKSIIADTKYKIIYSDESDPKNGISQNDLYQMLAYAMRFKVDKIILFYPNTVIENQSRSTSFLVKDSLADDKPISIKAFQLPVINTLLLQQNSSPELTLNELFETTRLTLMNCLNRILQ